MAKRRVVTRWYLWNRLGKLVPRKESMWAVWQQNWRFVFGDLDEMEGESRQCEQIGAATTWNLNSSICLLDRWFLMKYSCKRSLKDFSFEKYSTWTLEYKRNGLKNRLCWNQRCLMVSFWFWLVFLERQAVMTGQNRYWRSFYLESLSFRSESMDLDKLLGLSSSVSSIFVVSCCRQSYK